MDRFAGVLCVLRESDAGFSGVGSAIIAAIMNNRKAIGCEIHEDYILASKKRVKMLEDGVLPYRPLGKKIHQPTGKEKVSQVPIEWEK